MRASKWNSAEGGIGQPMPPSVFLSTVRAMPERCRSTDLTSRRRRALARAPLGLAVWLAAGIAAAQPGSPGSSGSKDAQAEKALKEAMETDYLETKFDKAEQRLRAAIDACGTDGCSTKVKARLFMALGSVLAHGKKQLEDARDAFVDGLGLDPNAQPDPQLSSTEISFAFEQARAALGAPSAPGAMEIKPPPEQRVRTPVPIFAELRAELIERTTRVTLWYLAPGARDFRSLVMKKLRDRGYGMNIPCDELRTEGVLKYYLTAVGADGAIVASAGSRDKPLTTAIKASITGEPPHWPGFAPPEMCAATAHEKLKQCVDDRQCNEGLTCVDGTCTPRVEAPPEKDLRRNWVSIAFWPDVSFFSGDEVCTLAEQDASHYVCLRSNRTRYDGTPTPNIGDNVNLGFALSTLRIALAYDRLLLDNLTVGGRAGVAFGGVTDGGASFLPLHLEVRGKYFFGKDPFDGLGVRPYALASAGLAQIDTGVDVQVFEDEAACGPVDTNGMCTNASPSGVHERQQQTLRAYKQAGQGFGSLGAGVMVEPVPGLALDFTVRASLTFPVVTVVASPEISVALGF